MTENLRIAEKVVPKQLYITLVIVPDEPGTNSILADSARCRSLSLPVGSSRTVRYCTVLLSLQVLVSELYQSIGTQTRAPVGTVLYCTVRYCTRTTVAT